MSASESDVGWRYHFVDPAGAIRWCGFTADKMERERAHRSKLHSQGILRTHGEKLTRAQARVWEKANKCPPYDEGRMTKRRRPSARRVASIYLEAKVHEAMHRRREDSLASLIRDLERFC